MALDKNTGEELWRADRDEQSNWTMPLILDFKGSKQVVISGAKMVRSYDLTNGKLLWESAGLGANVIPAPIHQEDLVYVMSGYLNPNLMAIRLGRAGDLTGSDAVLWSSTRGTSYSASPVLFDDKLYTITDRGMLSCYNARTGALLLSNGSGCRRRTLALNPRRCATGGRIAIMLRRPGRDCGQVGREVLGACHKRSGFGQFFMATPAIADGEIFLRGQSELFCISQKH